MKECPKCGYVRQPQDDDFVSELECPRCGIVYGKYSALEIGAAKEDDITSHGLKNGRKDVSQDDSLERIRMRKRPTLNNILSEEFWRNKEKHNKNDPPIIPWKEGFLFLLPLGGVLGTPILLTIINKAGKVSSRFWAKLGVRCSHTTAASFANKYEEVVFSLILTLKRRGNNIISAEDTINGARVVAELPQDLKSYPGTIAFEITETAPRQIEVFGTSEVKGQMTDWGKGKAALDEVFRSVATYLQK